MEIRVIPAAEAGWAAVESVLMADASTRNCWCQFHVLENRAARETTRGSRRDLLQRQVATLDPPRGLVALSGDQAVGWCGVEPRFRLGHVLAGSLTKKASPYDLDDPGVWAIYCIFVPKAFRSQGIAATLLSAAIRHATAHGAHAIEGYPFDLSGRDGQLPQGVSTGSLEMFEREGFEAVGALPSGRTLVHLDLREPDSPGSAGGVDHSGSGG